MLITIDDLSLLHPERVLLEFSRQEQDQLWGETENQNYQTASGRWQTYLNRLAARVFSRYISEEPDFIEPPRLWQEEKEQVNLCQWVNGTAIDLDSMRLVLIPSDEDELDELRVPQEWVELEDWVGHYYLAVQLDLEECYIQVLGFAEHQQLREQGRYDPLDQTYVLAEEDLIEDLNVMWVAREVSISLVTVHGSLVSLSNVDPEEILEQVSLGNFVIPRLEIPFPQWGALLSQASWRRSLSACGQSPSTQTASTPLINLKQWFQQEFAAGWQALDQLLTPQSMSLATSFRQGQQTAQGLRSFRQGQQTAQGLSVEGIKLIDLGVELGHQSVALLINLTKVTPEKVEVRVQLLPLAEQSYLPFRIQLALLSSSQKVLQEVQARTRDQLIQLKRFNCPVGKGFNLQITLDEFSWCETFLIQ
jgi:hypothetical protein